MSRRTVFIGVLGCLAGAFSVAGLSALAPEPFNLGSYEFTRDLVAKPTLATTQSEILSVDPEIQRALSDPDTGQLARLLESKVQANAVMADNFPLIYLAAIGGSSQSIRLLIEQGADPNARAPGGFTPLMGAVTASRADNVEALLNSGSKLDLHNEDGLLAVDLARVYGRADLLPKLAPRRAPKDVGAPQVTLYDAIVERNASDVATALRQGANPNAELTNGWTPLMFAAAMKCRDCMEALELQGADRGKKGRQGYGLLSVAVVSGSSELLGAVKDYPELRDQGDAAYLQALGLENLEAARLLRPLSSHGDDRWNAEARLMELAIRKHDLDRLAELLKLGLSANLTRPTDSASMPLICLESRAPIGMLELLLNNGANPNLASKTGMVPLLLAVMNEDFDSTKLLLKHRADDRANGGRSAASALVVSRSSSFQSAFWQTVGNRWRESAINAASAAGNTTLAVRLVGQDLLVPQIETSIRGGDQKLAAALLRASSLTGREVEAIVRTVGLSGDNEVQEAFVKYLDKLPFRDFALLYESIQRRNPSQLVRSRLVDTMTEWQAAYFVRSETLEISVDGKLPQPAIISRLAEFSSAATLEGFRESTARLGMICNASAKTLGLKYYFPSEGRSAGYFHLKPGRCTARVATIGFAVDGKTFTGFPQTIQSCYSDNAFNFKNSTDARECAKQGGRMETYYIFGDWVGRPIMVR